MNRSVEDIIQTAEGEFRAVLLTQTGSLSKPLIDHLLADEYIHHLLIHPNKGYKLTEPNGEERTPHHSMGLLNWGRRYLALTDRNILYIVGMKDGDEVERIDYNRIVDVGCNSKWIQDRIWFTTDNKNKYTFVNTENPSLEIKTAKNYINKQIGGDRGENDKKENQSKTNNTTSAETMDNIIEADRCVAKGDEFRNDGEFEKAISKYNNAIDTYEIEIENISQDQTIERINSELNEVQNKKESLSKLYESVSNLREQLQTAERNFREGITAYIKGSETVANIRFRQARDQFEKALEQSEMSESDLFETEIIVSSEIAIEPPQQDFTDYSHISNEALSILKEKGIKKPQNIDSNSNREGTAIIPQKLDFNLESENDAEVEAGLISCWYGNENIKFNSTDDISMRQKQAEIGFKIT